MQKLICCLSVSYPAQQNSSGLTLFHAWYPSIDSLPLLTGCGAAGDPSRACSPPALSWRWVHSFIPCLFARFLAVCYICACSACCLSPGSCLIYYHGSVNMISKLIVLHMHFCYLFSSLASCADRAGDNVGTKVFGKSSVTVKCLFNESRCLAELDIGVWGLKPICLLKNP